MCFTAKWGFTREIEIFKEGIQSTYTGVKVQAHTTREVTKRKKDIVKGFVTVCSGTYR